ncbi:MAG TPA: M4 family metallopeptidase [Vicinamibacteria bacterium]|nr:M4 family metallopeptidase [Vicinamibacteria bacterium]
MALSLLALGGAGAARAAEPRVQRLAAVEGAALHDWDARIESMLRAGELQVRRTHEDTLLPSRQHVRLNQAYKGVPVYGGQVVRQTEGERTVSVFGTLYEGIDVDPRPTLTPDQAAAVIEKLSGVDLGPSRVPQLVVYPRESGGYVLAYTTRAFSEAALTRYFIDARTGELVASRSELETQAAVSGTGTGVLGDRKKMSVRTAAGGGFLADDVFRPPSLVTFDMKGNLTRTLGFLNGVLGLGVNDIGADSDNTWTDGPLVDGHSYAGWTYDYYFLRFGRHGLDGNDLEILSLVHPVRREDIFSYSNSVISTFYLNAFYAGDGVMVYGEGLPPALRLTTGQRVEYLAGALDVVAHELTHGVTDYTSGLIYQGESGALNESFSDMMSAGAEFYFSGRAPGQADYLLGEDVFVPGGIRSMQNPFAYGDPDHYSIRFTGPEDNGGVHINSGIPNHVFYLAVVGGTNRVSGLPVTGVGQANIEQIEKVMYRAFTAMLPSSASFSTARAATIQSARDLYGAGSPAERAVTQAWNAVGVN